ncbi:MAG TPA: hypothetical protein RMH99_11330 [Sandaracinaceae bacterium LLY-WYZ-13_1]|nr:hypothetical protein [Sandaracinaceae bacterium LLY-WYZ-13_1]
MRRVIALSTSVMIATLVAGLAIAQDDEGTGEEVPPAGETAEGEAGGEGEGEPDEFAEPDPGAAAAADVGGEGEGGETATSAERDEGMDAGTYAVRLRDLEQRINELKEQIFRSKARLSLLAETVLQGVVAGAQAVIVHENRMSSSYRLVKAVYALDGARIFSKADEEGTLGERRELDIYDGSIVPGEHTLTVNLEYRGHGYGIFSYLKGYRFRVRSNYSFTAPEGKAITIRVVGYEKGGPTAPLEERPAIRYQETIQATRRGEEEGRDDGDSGDE